MSKPTQNFAPLRQHLKTNRHRQLLILSGSKEWRFNQLQSLFNALDSLFWITSQTDSKSQAKLPDELNEKCYQAIESKRLGYYLGQEIDGAVFSAEEGISADALGMTAGMIRAGGVLVVMTPEEEKWPHLANPEDSRFLNTPFTLNQSLKLFTQHLISCWKTNRVIWLHENQQVHDASDLQPQNSASKSTINLPSPDQVSAIEKIKSVAFGHRKRPLVMTADRGRGKSSALGLAAIECLLEGKQAITVTASRLDQVQKCFEQALLKLAPLTDSGEVKIVTQKPSLIEFNFQNQLKTLQYMAPDYLISHPSTADLLMVDEAAHLPTPLLIELLKRHHRMVFSTTLHGYEGSGRGFELRFKASLNKLTPEWKSLHLKTPIRWADNDPLEETIFNTLLLNAKTIDIPEDLKPLQAENLRYQKVDVNALLEDREKMQVLFGLLVQAHYQTSPNDLQQILNAPNIHIMTAEYMYDAVPESPAQAPLFAGAVLFIEEGKINPSKGRAHGHLVPQLLTKHYAKTDFLMLSTLRIMRIAVHPQLQRNGVGKGLIQQIEGYAQQKRFDYISSSFGASDELLPFWFGQNYWPLHFGVKRDKASGTHNLIVAKPVSAMSRQALSLIQTRFQEQFPHLLTEALPNLSATQVLLVIQTFRFKARNYGLDKAMTNYASGVRPYESISGRLWEWSLQNTTQIQKASPIEQSIWCDKILKRNDWLNVAHQYHLAGRKGVEKALKAMIDEWCKSRHSQQSVATKTTRSYLDKSS